MTLSARNIIRLVNRGLEKTTGYRLQPSADLRLRYSRMELLNGFGCNFVVDAGANIGQWALKLRKDGYCGEILSYEPSKLFSKLSKKVASDSLWEARKSALLDFEGTTILYYSSNQGLSSSTSKPSRILEHELGINFPESYPVSAVRLDKEVVNKENIYLKLDVQGSEMQALMGAQGILDKIAVVEFESSLIDLYEKESSHYEISSWLSVYGFKPLQLVITHWDQDLKTISLDSIFSRS